MTILKFRAWDEDSQRMNGNVEIYIDKDKTIEVRPKDDKTIIMQSTGLYDINGKEVFGGDLLATPFEEDGLFEIHMDTVASMYTKSTLTGKVQFIEDLDSLEELDGFKTEFAEYFEVVGNIYENPELLGE